MRISPRTFVRVVHSKKDMELMHVEGISVSQKPFTGVQENIETTTTVTPQTTTYDMTTPVAIAQNFPGKIER